MANKDTQQANLAIIDYSKIAFKGSNAGDASSLEESKAEKQRLYNSLRDIGFVYLSNHSISATKRKTLFDHARRFFALPEAEKIKLETGESKAFHGWFSPQRTSSNAKFSDQKEAFDMGDDNDPTRPNQWPENWPEFRQDMVDFFERCHEIHLDLLAALAEMVGLPSDHFVDNVKDKDHFFRVLHYPETSSESFKERVRAGTHTDYGTLTILFNDESGGLQVRGKDGKFFDAPPLPDCAVINVGDLLSRWFNDVLVSTEHRVIEPPSKPTTANGLIPSRYAVAWFGHPNRNALIEPLDVCCTPENPRKYTGVFAGKHVVERLAKLHKDGKNSEVWTDDMARKEKEKKEEDNDKTVHAGGPAQSEIAAY